MVTAESCTGGGISYFISKNPTCSSILERGYVVYSNTAKENLLEVPTYTIQTYGAVSKETIIAMAEGALKNSKASISIAVSGVDGTANENDRATTGIVWLACAGIDKKTETRVLKHKGGQKVFVENTILDGLKMLLTYVKDS